MDSFTNGAQAMVRMLKLHGVRHIFGLCGDTSLPFYDALAEAGDIQHILTRDERSAAYMADGYARVTGRPGVCEGPSGGGATYILPGVVEANESSIALLAITTDVATTSAGRYPLTELRQEELFRPLCKHNAVIRHAARLPALTRAAFRAMTAGRPGAAHLCFPFDVQKQNCAANDWWAESAHQTFPAWRTAPDATAIRQMVDFLASSQRPMIVCGGGVVSAGAEEALLQLAEKTHLAVATTISGKGAIAETHPLAVGVVGSNGGVSATRAALQQADAVIFVGCRAGSVSTEKWCAPAADNTAVNIAHIDSDPQVIGANYQTKVAMVADAKLALTALADAAEKTDFGGENLAAAAVQEKFADFGKLASSDVSPILPERLVHDLVAVLPPQAIVVADAGTPCPYLSAYWRQPQAGRYFITNRAHGALGFALPAAIGAQIGRPQSRVVAMMGDGSFGFSLGELETAVRLNLPIVFVVVANGSYGWIKAGQKSGFDQRYFAVDFTPGNAAAVAATFGLQTWRVENAADLSAAFTAAFACGKPALVDVLCQPLQDANAPVSEWVA